MQRWANLYEEGCKCPLLMLWTCAPGDRPKVEVQVRYSEGAASPRRPRSTSARHTPRIGAVGEKARGEPTHVGSWPISAAPTSRLRVRYWESRWGNRPASLWIAEDFGCCASG